MSPDRNPSHELLDRWLEGDLDAAGERELERAAAGDADLGARLASHRADRARLAELGATPLAAPDLWPAIAARIDRGGRLGRPPIRRWALAAATIAAVALAILAGRHARPTAVARVEPPAAAAAAPASPIELTAYAETDRQLATIRQELRAAIEAKRDALPPATREVVFRNLATIERAIADIETAMAEQPSDPDLARTYIDYRQRQIDLLRRANLLAARL